MSVLLRPWVCMPLVIGAWLYFMVWGMIGPTLEILFDYPLLPAVTLLAAALVYGGAFGSYGIAALFWHERPFPRTLAAMGLAALGMQVAATTYYLGDQLALTTGQPNPLDLAASPDDNDQTRFLAWMIKAAPPLVFLFVAPGLFPRLLQNAAGRPGAPVRKNDRRGVLWTAVGVVLGLAFSTGLFQAGLAVERLADRHADTDPFARWLVNDPDPQYREQLQLLDEVKRQNRPFLDRMPSDFEELDELAARADTFAKAAEKLPPADPVRQGVHDLHAHSMAARQAFHVGRAAPIVRHELTHVEDAARAIDLDTQQQYEELGVKVEQSRSVRTRGRIFLLLQLPVAFLVFFPVPFVGAWRWLPCGITMVLFLAVLVTLTSIYARYVVGEDLVGNAVIPGVWRIVVFWLAVALWIVLCNFREYKMTFPNMGDLYRRGNAVKLADHLRPNKPAGHDEAVLDAWRSQFPADAPPKLVLVAVSGGANRSAYWVSAVMQRLCNEIPDFARHVRVISGASGGMVGAAYFVRRLYDALHPRPEGERPTPAFPPIDTLTPVLDQFLLRDVPLMFLPFRQVRDRGRELDRAWSADLGIPLSAFAEDERAGRLPSLIFSPMLVEDGRRLLVSNLDLEYMTHATPALLTDARTAAEYGTHASLSAFEFAKLFPDAVATFQVGTAARMSATFPYVSPAVNLPTEPTRSVVDAGYYDIYGISVVASWLQQHREWVAENTSGVCVVQIRDEIDSDGRVGLGAGVGDPFLMRLSRAFRFVTAPLAGAAKAMYASSSFRNDEYLSILSDWFASHEPRTAEGLPFFQTVAFESPARVAMNWYLSATDCAELDQGIDMPDAAAPKTEATEELSARNDDLVAALRRWWSR